MKALCGMKTEAIDSSDQSLIVSSVTLTRECFWMNHLSWLPKIITQLTFHFWWASRVTRGPLWMVRRWPWKYFKCVTNDYILPQKCGWATASKATESLRTISSRLFFPLCWENLTLMGSASDRWGFVQEVFRGEVSPTLKKWKKLNEYSFLPWLTPAMFNPLTFKRLIPKLF